MMQRRTFWVLWASLAAVGGLWAQNDATEHDPSHTERSHATHARENYVQRTHGCACGHLRAQVSRIFRTSRSALGTAQEFILDTDETWCAFWDKVHAGLQPKLPCQGLGVDFSHETVVAVTLGEHSSCYGIEIDHMDRTDEEGVYVVVVNELERSSDCRCNEALVRPVDAVKIEGPVTAVFVERSVKPVPCSWGRPLPTRRPRRPYFRPLL
jgi:hypothetical protein